MRCILIWLFSISCLFANSGVYLSEQNSGGVTTSFHLTRNSPVRMDMVMWNWQLAGSAGFAPSTAGITGFRLRMAGPGSTILQCLSDIDAGGGIPQHDLAGRAGFAVRCQRDPTRGRITFEIWNLDGTGYAVSTTTPSNWGSVNGTSTVFLGKYGSSAPSNLLYGYVGCFRISTELVTVGSPPPYAADVPKGNVVSWEFEDDLKDSSENNSTLKMDQQVTYEPEAAHPPHCSAGDRLIFRAGARAFLDATNSYVSEGRTPASYLWQQISGPTNVVFEDETQARPSIAGLIFGSYVFQLTITDNTGASSTCTVKHGAVATDNKGIVIVPNRAHARFMSSLTRFGENQWSFYDDRQKAMSDWLVAAIDSRFGPAWNDAAPGTVTLQHNSAKVYGDGTSFQTTFCGGPGNTTPVAGSRILFWYPSLLYPGETGRRPYPIYKCDSDTELTLGRSSTDQWVYRRFDHAGDGPGIQYSLDNSNVVASWVFGPAPANYYDNVVGLYAMYYRTGIDDYLETARKLADRWWEWYMIDKGHAYIPNTGYWIFAEPRSVALTGLMLRALDERPEMWVGIRRFIDYYAPNLTAKAPVSDLRNQGYQLMWTSLAAIFDPDPDVRAVNLNRIQTSMENKWIPYRQPDGSWLMRVGIESVGLGGTLYTGKAHVTNGSTAVTGSGTNFTKLDGNGGGCAPGQYIWFTTANSVLTTTGGINGDRIAYEIVSRPDDSNITLKTPYEGEDGPKNYACGGFVGAGVQPFMLAITASGLRWAYEALQQSPDPYHQTLAETARTFVVGIGEWITTVGTHGPSKGIYYGRTFPSCEATPMPGFCYNNGNIEALRINAAEALNGVILAYMLSKDERLKNSADTLANGLYAQPGSSDYDGNYMKELNTGGYLFNPSNPLYIPKWYGWFFGISANWSWPGVRIGGIDPEDLRSVDIAINIAEVRDAKKVRISVTRPSGTHEIFTCYSSPCTVQVDGRQHEHLLRFDFLSEADEVLASRDRQMVTAP
jgi:hypothetical protein